MSLNPFVLIKQYTGALLKWIYLFSLWFQLFHYAPLYFSSIVGNVLLSLWFKAFLITGSGIVLYRRVTHEEKVLKVHFGKEWDAYASQRKRFVPYVF